MIVLGFDTATQASAVGLRLPDGHTLHVRDDPAQGQHPGHATRLLAMAAELLAQADLRWGELERIAVGVGPGRFTGLRVGIATARGLAQSLGAQLLGVSSLRALGLAAAAAARGSDAQAMTGTIAVIDARRGEAFIAAYPPGDPQLAAAAAGEIAFPSALRPPELAGLIARIEAHGGPQGQRWRAVGDGALLYEQALADGGIELAPRDSPLHLIDGAAICELGAQAHSQVASDGSLTAILPDYRRAPDAALARAPAPVSTSTPASPERPKPTPPAAVGGRGS